MSLHSCSNNVRKKGTEVYCKLFLFSGFLNKLLLAKTEGHSAVIGNRRKKLVKQFRSDVQAIAMEM